MKTITSTDFYSDQVEVKPTTTTRHSFLTPLMQGKSLILKDYVSEFQAHINAVENITLDPEVKDVRVSWVVMTDGETSIKLFGTKPWSKDKVDTFENAAKNEKTEIDQLRLLIGKYPGKAAATLGYMLEQQKTG